MRYQDIARTPHSLTHPNPTRYTLKSLSGSSSVVECYLAKVDVAGSTPVSRSKSLLQRLREQLPFSAKRNSHQGAVPKW